MRPNTLRLLAAPMRIATTLPLQAFDINDQLSADGFILGAWQCQNVSALVPGKAYGEVLDDTVVPPLPEDSMANFGNECAVPCRFRWNGFPS